MSFLFWTCFFLLIYIYLGYFLILNFLSKVFHPQHPVANEDRIFSVTILFAARNERPSLPVKIESLRCIDYPKDRLQILVASDASTDGSNEYLAEQKDIETVVLENRLGKNSALNALLPKAKGEVLFFTDANTILHPSCLRAVVRHFNNPKVGAVAGELIFTHDADWNPVGRGAGLYWRFENSIKRCESRLGSVLVGGGSLLAVRRELVDRLDPRVANDLEIPTRIGAKGFQVLYEPECLGFEKPHIDVREELRRTSRIVARGFRGFWVLLPFLLKSPLRLWQFITHKFLRWFTLPLAFLMWISAWNLREQWIPGLIFYGGCFGWLGVGVGLFAIMRSIPSRSMKPFALLAHLFIMNAAALWGIGMALTGRAPATWSVPQSTRTGL